MTRSTARAGTPAVYCPPAAMGSMPERSPALPSVRSGPMGVESTADPGVVVTPAGHGRARA